MGTVHRKGQREPSSAKIDDHWDDSGEANTAVTRQLVETRSTYAKTHHLALSDFHFVSGPALNAYFVAVNTDADTIVIPVENRPPSTGVVAGVQQTAAKLLPKLATAAEDSRSVNGKQARGQERDVYVDAGSTW